MTRLPTKAFLDTTILTDALLKQNEQGRCARTAVSRYDITELPTYAIKEFKAGPLRNYVWFYNKVVSLSSWEDAVATIPSVRRQFNKMSTALQALADFEGSISKALPSDFITKHPGRTMGEIKKKEAEVWLKTKIFYAWMQRRHLATNVVEPLSCYEERDPVINKHRLIIDKPVHCPTDDCCLRSQFTGKSALTAELFKACESLPAKAETTKRRQILRQLVRHPERPLEDKDCRNLGDAVFALQCPKDAVILTTNMADHSILAAAAGVSAEHP